MSDFDYSFGEIIFNFSDNWPFDKCSVCPSNVGTSNQMDGAAFAMQYLPVTNKIALVFRCN